jgi:predicted extracellular nuclease
VEFTNVSNAPVNMTDWSEDDSNRIPGKHAFGNTFGIVQPGESVVLTAAPEATFRAAWNLPASVKVWAGATGTGYTDDNLGRSDEINLYDGLGTLVDSLTYNDQGSGNVKGPRTQNSSGNIPLSALGMNNASTAVLSTVGDSFHSYASTASTVGNPGSYAPATVPEPTSLILFATGLLCYTPRRRRN